MKNLLLILVIHFSCLNIQAQQKSNVPEKFPTTFENSFTFPLGSKILLELKETKNGKYDYRIINIERVDGYYSFEADEDLFTENPKENTVEIYFMGAYKNDGKEDKDWKSLLMIRNNLKNPINYKADIKYYFKEDFENTSIVGAFPNAKTQEIWAHKIDFITLYDFEKLKK